MAEPIPISKTETTCNCFMAGCTMTNTGYKCDKCGNIITYEEALEILNTSIEAMNEGILIGKRKQFEETYLQDHGKMPPADQYPTK